MKLTFLTRSLFASAVVACGAAAVPLEASLAEDVLALDRPLVIAHRGYSGLAPENTAAAFDFALQAGVDLIELDYHVSQDKVALAFHDLTLDRTTDAVSRWGGEQLALADYPAKELLALDTGSWFGAGFAAERMLPLESAVRQIQSGGGITLIERKAGAAADCAALLRENDWVNAVVVQAFDWEFLAEMRTELPDQVLGALGPWREVDGRRLTEAERFLSPQWIDAARAAGAQVIGWNRQVTAEAVAYAHARGLKVWIYTINEEALATSLLDLGVDGIITDHPSVIWRALALRSLKASGES